MKRNERVLMKKEIAHLLDELGTTPDGVAGSLGRSGVRGDRFLVSRCPVARYLHAVVGGDPRVGKVKVGLYKAVVNGPRWYRPVTVALPTPVRLFVLAFDSGHYAQLISRSNAPSTSDRGEPTELVGTQS
jgi:hypothetical protein